MKIQYMSDLHLEFGPMAMPDQLGYVGYEQQWNFDPHMYKEV